MTNREWLESLSDYEFASMITRITEIARPYCFGYIDAASGIEKWLQTEKKEEE